MSGNQPPNQHQARFNPNTPPVVSGAMGNGPRGHPRQNNPNPPGAPYVPQMAFNPQMYPAPGGSPYTMPPNQPPRTEMGGPRPAAPPQPGQHAGGRSEKEMSDRAKEMRRKLQEKKQKKSGAASDKSAPASQSASSDEAVSSTVSSTSEEHTAVHTETSDATNNKFIEAIQQRRKEKSGSTAESSESAAHNGATEYSPSSSEASTVTQTSDVGSSAGETPRVSAFRSVQPSEFDPSPSNAAAEDSHVGSIIQQQSAVTTSQDTTGVTDVTHGETGQQFSLTVPDPVQDAQQNEDIRSSRTSPKSTAPSIGCPDSHPIELVSNEHDGDENKISYTMDTLRRLEPPKMQFNFPSLLFNKDFEIRETDSRESNKGGHRGNAAKRGGSSFGGRGGFPDGGRPNQKAKGGGFPGWREQPGGGKKKDPYEELGRTGKAFTKREKDTSEIGKAKKTVTDVCNKLSRDNFNKLSDELVKMQIPSFDVLKTVINLIFDKALEFQTFQDLFADLCKQLSKKADVWTNNFAQYTQDDQGWYFDLSGAINDETKEPEWEGPFSSEDEAKRNATQRSSFKRLLLNRCQEEFEREGAYETIENERKEMEKKLQEMRETSPSGAPPADMVKEKEKKEEEWAAQELKIKRRMLANIGFIGHLYMSNLLTDAIVSFCIDRLLYQKNGETLDEENVEALLKLLLLVGKKYEKNTRGNRQGKVVSMESVMETVQELSKDKRLPSRLRFRCLDVIEARGNGWKMPEHHVAAAAKTMSKNDFRKQALEEDMKKNQEVEGLRSKYSHDSDFKKSSAKPRQDAKLSSQLGPSRHESRGNRGGGTGSVATGRPKVFGPRTGLMKRNKEAESSQGSGEAGKPKVGGRNEAETTEAPQERTEKEIAPSMDPETRDKAKQRIHNSFKEYQELQDKDEFLDSVKEIYSLTGGPPLYVVTAVEMLRTSRSAKDRRAVEQGLLKLAEEKYFSASDVQVGIATYLPDFSADLEDAPHLDSYIAELLSELVRADIVSVVKIAEVCGTEGGFRCGVATRLVAALVSYASREGRDESPDTQKMTQYLESLRKESVGLADLYGPGALKKTVTRLTELHIDEDVSYDMKIFKAASAVVSNKFSLSDTAADMQKDSVFIRVVLSELIYSAGDMGMGPEDAADDLQWLESHVETLQTLFKSGGSDNVPYLLETVVQTIHANPHSMYETPWFPTIDKAYIDWLVKHNVLSNDDVKHWATQFQPRRPFGWIHAEAVASVQ